MTRPTEHPVALAVSACLLLAASPALRAQQAAAPAAAAASAPARPQQVEVTGTTAPESSDERRRATASRITYGREELDRMGDASLGEVLKRLPGVTLGGPPGLDPTAGAASAIAEVVQYNVLETLTKIRADSTIAPLLATSWTVTA